MVHRAPDSRLLSNLIDHEKEYTKHLAALFPLSHAALASLSAYAAASPSTHPTSPARAITAVVDVLASTDDAFQRYTHAIDTWREQLVALKALEDDLVSILRDRDILVTRLIKASKSTRDAHRSSRLVAPLTTLGSASFSSLPSTNSTTFSSTGSSPASTNAKLAQAQAELQACEAHLVSKEHELDARRITLARDGLGARCRALIDCGWVWGEMGRQGLKALQALSADESDNAHPAPKASRTVPPRPTANANAITYASDNSSLTPSQSASQTAPRSSHEDPSSKGHEDVQPEAEPGTTSKPPRSSEDGNLTITLPPAHAITEMALPTSLPAQSRPPENGDVTAPGNAAADVHTTTQGTPAPALRRKRTKRSRRPPSQHITEASDEGEDSNAPPSAPASRTTNANPNPRALVPHTQFPNTSASEHDTTSDDEPTGPLQVVENDPFEVIRKSMLGSSASNVAGSPLLVGTSPTAHASAPDVRVSAVYDTSPINFPGSVSGHERATDTGMGAGIGLGSPPGSSPTKRHRRTSFFGSLRGLFRKPKGRERFTGWDEGIASPSPSPSRTRTGGWVTRTDARIRARGRENSDDEATPAPAPASTQAQRRKETTVTRAPSGARLRKGRPGGASTRSNGPSRGPSYRTGMDGWITDTPATRAQGTTRASIDTPGPRAVAALGRSRTRRGTVKKTSVADLRGSDQGHTDGELEEERCSLERVANGTKGKALEAKPIIEVEGENPLPANGNAAADPDLGIEPNGDAKANPPRRAMTTAATSTSRKPSSNVAPAHRRSASLSHVDAHVTLVAASTSSSGSSQGSTQGMSWRKPPPQVESSSQAELQSEIQVQAQPPPRSQTQDAQPTKRGGRRTLPSGHAKHTQNQNLSLMSIVANVNLDPNQVIDRGARSLDVPRASGSVLNECEDERELETEVNENRREKGRAASEDIGMGTEQSQRTVKLPLKSALRNTSRTPSPSPNPPVVVPTGEVKGAREVKKEAGGDRGRSRVGSLSPPWRDSASISSYETGRESLDGEGDGRRVVVRLSSPPRSPARSPSPSPSPPPLRPPSVRPQSQPPAARSQSPVLRTREGTPSPPPFTFPPPPVEPPPVRTLNANHNGSASSNPVSTANANLNPVPNADKSASTETPPVQTQRRKSVRMSLQPTFSSTPPDEESEYAPWSGDGEGEKERERERGGKRTGTARERERGDKGKGKGKEAQKKGIKPGQDVWADSSDEDETYARARRLLSLVGRSKT